MVIVEIVAVACFLAAALLAAIRRGWDVALVAVGLLLVTLAQSTLIT